MQHRVLVFGLYYSVGAFQESDTVWHAVAEYKGEVLTVEARTEWAALRLWREQAEAMGKP